MTDRKVLTSVIEIDTHIYCFQDCRFEAFFKRKILVSLGAIIDSALNLVRPMIDTSKPLQDDTKIPKQVRWFPQIFLGTASLQHHF